MSARPAVKTRGKEEVGVRSEPAPPLAIRIKRLPDGSAALTCTRADGSVTWQRQRGVRGIVFPLHDLTHYAVETVLGCERGFYGLLAAGWEFADFSAPWPRGPIPDEARAAELIVGLFEVERRTGFRANAEEMRAQAELHTAASKGNRRAVALPPLTNDKIAQIRALLADLFRRWAAVEPGAALELSFPRAAN